MFSVESDKAVLEVEATAEGFLRKILVPAGDKVPVLTVVALITRTADEEIAGREAEGAPTTVRRPQSRRRHLGRSRPWRSPPEGGRLFASPRARKAAREKGIDLAQVTGSGPAGALSSATCWASLLPSVRCGCPLPGRSRLRRWRPRPPQALGVDLAAVRGTGAGGRIMKADVEAAAPRGPAAAHA